MHWSQHVNEETRALEPLAEEDVGELDICTLLDIASQRLSSQEVLETEHPPSVPAPPDISQQTRQTTSPESDPKILQAVVQTRRSTRGRVRQNGQASVSPTSPSSEEAPQRSKAAPMGRARLAAALQQEGSSSDAEDCNEEDGLATLRAKNRRAQRKCRERQKQKLAVSEARARDLEACLERLKLEKLALEARAALLESLVGVGEGGGGRRRLPLPEPDEPPERRERRRTCGASDAQRPQSTAGYGGWSRALKKRVSHTLLQEEVEELEEDISCGVNDAMLEMWRPQVELVRLTVYQGRPRRARTPETISLSLEQFTSLPLGDLAELWREYVAAMSPLLDEARADVASPAGHRTVQLAGEVRRVVSSLMSANPKGWSTLRAVQMDPEGGAPLMAQPPQGWWCKVYRGMGLSVRQRRLAVAYRNRMLMRMGATLRTRRHLQQCSQQQPLPEYTGFDMHGGIAVAQGLLAASDAAEALRANIAEEQQLHNEFLCSVRSVLEPLQSAIAIVHSYPWCPEALAIINCCAEEEGAPAAHALLSGVYPCGPANGFASTYNVTTTGMDTGHAPYACHAPPPSLQPLQSLQPHVPNWGFTAPHQAPIGCPGDGHGFPDFGP